MIEGMIQESYVPDSAYDQRQPYQLIYLSIFECCNTYRRHKIGNILSLSIHVEKGWSKNEDERGYAFEQLEGSYTFSVEELMFLVAHLILDGGRSFDNEKWMNYHREKIQKILQKNDLRTMLEELPQPERKYFEYDLRLLKPLGLFGDWE
jgi:hypothetical protein